MVVKVYTAPGCAFCVIIENFLKRNNIKFKEIDISKNAKGFHAALICLKKGVELPPHPEDYGVLLTVLGGKGIFTDSRGAFDLGKNQSIYIKKDEIRGIKAEEDLIILGIQDRGKGGCEK